ncbi:hypothetical protein DYB30_005265 [Aphanomyces astaci]|uniref:DNA-directed primase/polymerase protein n=1 Tax=Aphanomyces astaci TaxID=112090 RepID=A0A397EEQ6_APHAT|nr:hypothetical protein DYB34_000597 [Aphanomyces astaci]RHY59842.1 hypothetical protein DYB38_002059 [Aphanomyces astaci]RHY77246.1 hypothetical protein DYB30_005265 [Aphanomyces astaci]RHY81569.1 hypothetical protein DYB31_007392 [Aphanomyces astaci]
MVTCSILYPQHARILTFPMRFRLRLAIDDEDVGTVDVECRAAEKMVLFHMKHRALVLREAHITAFLRPPSSSTTARDPSQLCTAFPTIPWLTDDCATGGTTLLRKRPRNTSVGVSFYGRPSSDPSSTPMVNTAFDAAFHYRIRHSIECQIDGTAPVHHVFALQQPAIDFLRRIQARRSTHNLKLFSFETRGSRKFLVSDVDVFYDMYMQTPPTKRHVYEIIQDNVPCHLYFDLGRNRAFRCVWSSKYNSDRILTRHPDCHVAAASDKAFFLHTLICPITSSSSSSRRRLLRCRRRRSSAARPQHAPYDCPSLVGTAVMNGGGTSPMPQLESFVTALATRTNGVDAAVRAWQVTHRMSITFHLMHNRFCHHVRRAHKSNNVMYVVDLVRHVVVQRCHDPLCAHYTSPPWPVPPALCATSIESYMPDDAPSG